MVSALTVVAPGREEEAPSTREHKGGREGARRRAEQRMGCEPCGPKINGRPPGWQRCHLSATETAAAPGGWVMSPKILGLISFAACAVSIAAASSSAAAPPPAPASENLGPYNVVVLEGSVGMQRPLAADAGVAAAGTPWSLAGWMLSTRRQTGTVIVAAVGDTDGPSAAWRGIVLRDGELGFELSPQITLRSGVQLEPGRWHHIAATYDGATARLYLDGRERAALDATTVQAVPRIAIAPTPRDQAPGGSMHFGGSLASLTLEPSALDAHAVRLRAAAPRISRSSASIIWASAGRCRSGRGADCRPRRTLGRCRRAAVRRARRAPFLWWRGRPAVSRPSRRVCGRSMRGTSVPRRRLRPMGRVVASGLSRTTLVRRGGAGNGAHDADRAGNLSRPAIRTGQSRHSRQLEPS